MKKNFLTHWINHHKKLTKFQLKSSGAAFINAYNLQNNLVFHLQHYSTSTNKQNKKGQPEKENKALALVVTPKNEITVTKPAADAAETFVQKLRRVLTIPVPRVWLKVTVALFLVVWGSFLGGLCGIVLPQRAELHALETRLEKLKEWIKKVLDEAMARRDLKKAVLKDQQEAPGPWNWYVSPTFVHTAILFITGLFKGGVWTLVPFLTEPNAVRTPTVPLWKVLVLAVLTLLGLIALGWLIWSYYNNIILIAAKLSNIASAKEEFEKKLTKINKEIEKLEAQRVAQEKQNKKSSTWTRYIADIGWAVLLTVQGVPLAYKKWGTGNK